MKKIVITVPNLSSNKTKPSILKIISNLQGVDMVKFDENKSKMTVVGTVDPVILVEALRKKKKQASIASVGNINPETEKEEKYRYQYQDGYEYQDYRGYETYRPVQYIPVSYYNEPSGCTIV